MNPELGFYSLGALMVLLVLRVPIGLALTAVAFVGLYLLRGFNPAFGVLKSTPFEFVAHWTLSAVPMFVLIGAIASHSGMVKRIFGSLKLWLGWLPGGLAIATSFAGAGFAAMSGSSLATTAAMGRIAVPEMLKEGYQPALATGVATAVGTIGALIPPSIIMVIYATFAEVSAAKMLVAGVVPGLLTALAYASLVFIRCLLNPSLAPIIARRRADRREHLRAFVDVLPVLILAIGITGSIYSGIATSTEAAGFGVLLTLIIVMAQRALSWGGLRDSLYETTVSTASIFMIAIGAAMMTQFLAFTGMPRVLSGAIMGVTDDPVGIMLICCLLYLVLGCFLDPMGVMLLTLPILLPIIENAHINPIWAGVILVKMLEVGLLTPPVGLNTFIMKGTLGGQVSLGTIIAGTSWFLTVEVVVVGLMLAFPQIILFLPSLME
ncbi:TRAP transporter large permease [Cereibacter sphaeroides]|nr:TRAP transporter large permease [Cereibacter sphaeroides]